MVSNRPASVNYFLKKICFVSIKVVEAPAGVTFLMLLRAVAATYFSKCPTSQTPTARQVHCCQRRALRPCRDSALGLCCKPCVRLQQRNRLATVAGWYCNSCRVLGYVTWMGLSWRILL